MTHGSEHFLWTQRHHTAAFTVCEGRQIVATGAITAAEPANAPPPPR
jgi:hypothetical protein